MAASLQEILDGFSARKLGALARGISWVEDGDPRAEELLDALHDRTGKAVRIGVTGPPGAGKSTLVDGLILAWHEILDRDVALLAVDPSSPFTGGALLGDRIRLNRSLEKGEHQTFVRSMATRGSLGGLARAAGAAADLMDAFGFPVILMETVGVGQAEVDIAAAADCTVVVLTPQSGDGIQAMKAGLLEAADILVVNKADLPGAEALATELEQMVELRPEDSAAVPVLSCQATDGTGVEDLCRAVEAALAMAQASGAQDARRARRDKARVLRLLGEEFRARLIAEPRFSARIQSLLTEGARPDALARQLLDEVSSSSLDGIQT